MLEVSWEESAVCCSKMLLYLSVKDSGHGRVSSTANWYMRSRSSGGRARKELVLVFIDAISRALEMLHVHCRR